MKYLGHNKNIKDRAKEITLTNCLVNRILAKKPCSYVCETCQKVSMKFLRRVCFTISH